METCKDLIPYKSYPSHGKVILLLFIISGSVLIGITTDLSNTVNFSCNPDKNIGADLTQKTFIQTSCLTKYEETYNSPIPLHCCIILSFGLVLSLSLVYAVSVKSRIGKFDRSVATNNIIELGLLQQNPMSSETGHVLNIKSCIPVFYIYIAQLLFVRIIITTLFAGLIFFPSNFPTEFPCPWSSPSLNATQDSLGQRNASTVTVECKNPVASKNKTSAMAVGIVNIVFALITLIEAMYLVWKVCGNKSYSSDNEFCSVYLLQKREELHEIEDYNKTRINAIIDCYKENVKSKVRKEVKSYIRPIILQERRDENHRGNTRREEVFQSYIKDPDPSKYIDDMEDLFKNATQPPRRILVIGRPGIGKSTLSKKILSDWTGAEKDHFYYEKIIILLQFRSLNFGKETTLKKMLRKSFGILKLKLDEFDCLFEYISENPKKVVLIFDGLDELKVDNNCVDDEKTDPDNHLEQMSIFSLWYKLMSGTLLPGATLITTSRPTADHLYSKLGKDVDKTLEIVGFTESRIEKFVEEFCRKRKLESKTLIWGQIKASAELLSLCYVPVTTYIVCSTLERCESDESIPKTLTELYKRAIAKILWDHNRHKKRRNSEKFDDFLESESLLEQLVQPKSVALTGMKNEKLIFRRKEVRRDIKDCGLFNQLEDENASQFCFLHLTFQEFLAAWKLVDDCKGYSDVDTILSKYLQDPSWNMVIQFFAGLVGDKVREGKLSKDCYQCFLKRIPSDVSDWEKTLGRDVLLMIKCLHELQEPEIVASTAGEIMCKDKLIFGGAGISRIAPADCTAFSQLLMHIKNLHILSLFGHYFGDSGCRELVKLFENKFNELTLVMLSGNLITYEGFQDLCCALKNVNCKLTFIDLSYNNITYKGGQDLCCALKNVNCQLTNIDLSHNNITDKSVRDLCCALKNENCKLTSIQLRGNKITDDGVQDLCFALKNVNCKLTFIDLSDNKITDKGVQDLCCALKNVNCKLTSIGLRSNEITDKGHRDLVAALENRNCKLLI